MGAHNIEFTLKGRKSKTQIETAFEEQQEEDKYYNGHRDGYSGDFQTVNDVKFNLSKIFESYSEAHNYCLDNAKKWSYVIAVYYKDFYINKDKTIDKLRVKLELEEDKLRTLKMDSLNGLINAKSKTIGCRKCSSSINRKYLGSTKCPICKETLLSTTVLKKLHSQKKRVESVANKIYDREKYLSSKEVNISTLVAGWGAC